MRKVKDDGKCERARVHVQKLMKTERDSEELRRLCCLDRVFGEKATCSVCYEKAHFLGPGREIHGAIIAPRTQSGPRRSRGRRRGAAPPCGGADVRDQRNLKKKCHYTTVTVTASCVCEM